MKLLLMVVIIRGCRSILKIFLTGEISSINFSLSIYSDKLQSTLPEISVAELKRIITEQYLASYADFNELTFNKSFLDLGYKENEIIGKFVSQGLCKQTDYLSLQIETQSQEILVNQLEESV